MVSALESAIKARVGNVGVCYSKHLAYHRVWNAQALRIALVEY
jgi:hypothetical protein